MKNFFLLSYIILFPILTFAETLSGKVIGISDGDTITVLSNKIPVKIRLNGIDCPENTQDFGTRAKQAASDIAYGKEAAVNSHGKDRYGRVIGDITVGSINLNHALVEKGLCWWYRKYAPNDTVLKNLEQEARTSKRGLWSQPNPIPPWEFRKSGPMKYQIPSHEEGKIIGNKNSKVYHWPGCPSYGKVSPKNRIYFTSKEIAEQSGYRGAKNCR
ncbi:MAG TPA: thermonuclease family protein [Oligoflexia bacterium]|nr:thermonuclease family protein [Oligoflexia bacterium]